MLYWVPHCCIVFLKSSRSSLLIKRAALGNLKASFHCTHWHRFFPLKKVFFEFLRLPLAKGSSTFSPSPSSSGSGDVTALLGARNRCALRLADHQRSRHVVRAGTAWRKTKYLERSHRGKIEVICLFIYVLIDDKPFYKVALNAKKIYPQEVQT